MGDLSVCVISGRRVGKELKLWETPVFCGGIDSYLSGVPILYLKESEVFWLWMHHNSEVGFNAVKPA